MIGEITFGQYYHGSSVLHKADPRIKLIASFWLIVVIFVCKNFLSLGIIAFTALLTALISRVPAKMILKSLKPIVIILIFTAILNIFYTQGGATYFEWWKIKVTEKGINTAIFTMIRIISLVVISSILTYTTTPTALTDGLERVLSPLKVFKIKVHTLAMMMTLALRFIPTLIQEIERIMNAQKARGADLETGGILQRAKALVPIFIPLMVSSFRRAYELALAMTCRCYTGGDGRTRMKQMKVSFRDIMLLLWCIASTAGIILLNFYFEAVI